MKAKKGLMFMAGFLTSILTIILVLGITVGVLGTTKRVGDITRMSPTTEKLIDPESELGKKTILDAYKMIRKDLDHLGDVPLKELKTKYGINLPDKFNGVLSFIDPKEIYEFSIRNMTQNTPEVVDALLKSFKINKALENLGFLGTIESAVPFDIIKNPETGILSKTGFEIKSMLDNGTLFNTLQENIKFKEVTRLLNVDLENDPKLKDIDFFKNIGDKNINAAIDSFKNIGGEIKVKDVTKFVGIDFMTDDRFKDINFFRNLNDKPVNQLLDATQNISSELTLGNILKIANVDDSKLKTLKDKNLLDKPIKQIIDDKDAILDDFILSDFVDVDVAPYYEDALGNYVMIPSTYYVECDESVFGKLNGERFRKESVEEDGEIVAKYFEDTTGKYLKYSFGYFTLFNPSKADHSGLTRYSLAISSEFSIIHPKNIKEDSELYTYNTATASFDPYVAGKYNFLYQKKDSSSKLLQRLFNTKIKKPDDTIKELILSDVIDIKSDKFVDDGVVSSSSVFDPSAKYAVFENNRFSFVDVTLPNFKTKYDGKNLYRLASEGTSEKLLKLLSFVGFGDGAESLNSFFQTATLKDFANVEFDKYEEDVHGEFVFSEDGNGGNFIPYNAYEHDSLTRYKRTHKSATNSVLKRAANTKLNAITSIFDNLYVGEVLDVKNDIFKLATTPATDRKYYKYVDGVYTLLDSWENPCYEKEKIGESHAVLKKLSHVKFNDLSGKVDNILKNVFLDELFELNPYNIVNDAGVANKKFIEQYNRYSKNGYSFVEDPQGIYVRSDVLYEKATPAQRGTTKTINFNWVSVQDYFNYLTVTLHKTPDAALAEIKNSHLYVKDGGTYHFNQTWALYRIKKFASSLNNSKVYIRTASSSVGGTAGTTTAYEGKNLSLYDPAKNEYVPYNESQIGLLGHDDLVYYTYKDGYCRYDKATSYTAPLSELYQLNSSGAYVPATSDSEPLYYKRTAGGETRLYFVLASDDAINPSHIDNTKKYKMISCEEILKEDASGEYKLFDNKLSKLNPGEAYSGKRFSILYGALVDSSSEGPSFLTSDIHCSTEASLRLLVSLSKKGGNMNNINSIMSSLALSELFDLPPNFIFAHPDLKTATLQNLPDKFKTLMSSMTIADLCNYGEYSIQHKVFSALGKIKINKFMESLEIGDGGLEINHDNLFKP